MREDAISIELPEPPSANDYWRSVVIKGKVRVLVSAEAKAYRAAVHARCWQCGIGRTAAEFPKAARLSVEIAWHRTRKSGDLDNRLKQVLDALKGLAFVDDEQVVYLVASRHDPEEDEKRGFVDVTISEVPV